jgi:hypothetical protein
MKSPAPGGVSEVEAYDLITMISVPLTVIVLIEFLRFHLSGREPIGSSAIS